MEITDIIFKDRNTGESVSMTVTEDENGIPNITFNDELFNITNKDVAKFTKLFYRCYHLFVYILKLDNRKDKGGTIVGDGKA